MLPDPILGTSVPQLFAHRGGAGECPESTQQGFLHATVSKADVLEFDLQLTKDGEMVVWHGPKLDNVWGKDGLLLGRKIWEFDWEELKDRAWVLGPGEDPRKADFQPVKTDERLIITFKELIDYVITDLDNRAGRKLPLNIEIKKTETPAPDWTDKDRAGTRIWKKFFVQIGRAQRGDRKVIIASANRRLLRRFRTACRRRQGGGACVISTNVAWSKQIAYFKHASNWLVRLAGKLVGFQNLISFGKIKSLRNRAYETSYALASKSLVKKVRRAGGATYVFLTKFGPLKAIDSPNNRKLKEEIFEILDFGVDGIMTDFPRHIRPILDEWIANH